MQNLANITKTEVVVVTSAILVLCVAPTVVAWSDARRRRRALAKAAALEAAAREALLREAEAREAAAREAAAGEAAMHEPSAQPAGLMGVPLLWDEPTVTLDVDALEAPSSLARDAAVFEVPAERPTPATSEAPPPSAEPAPPLAAAPPVPAQVEPASLPPTPLEPAAAAAPVLPTPTSPAPAPVAPPALGERETPLGPASVASPEPMREPETPAESPRFEFCLQELRRVRLPNWPPDEVHADPVRSQLWRDAERLVAQHQREIGATRLAAPHPVQSSCLGAAETDAAGMRLRFFLFPVLWPSTVEQASAEAVFEIEPGGGTIRGSVNSLRRPG